MDTLPEQTIVKTGYNVYRYKSLPSTQIFYKKRLEENTIKPFDIVLADHQSHGLGTRGRKWHAIEGCQLTFSALIPCPLPLHRMPLLNIFLALKMIQAMSIHNPPFPQIKWPNDIFLNNKKCGGILSEIINVNNQDHLLFGIGLNLKGNSESIPTSIQESATTLSMNDHHVNRDKILFQFYENLLTSIDSSHLEKELESIQQEFEKKWIYLNKKIRVTEENTTTEGIAKGIDHQGALILQTINGNQKIQSGTIELIRATDH